VHFVSAFTLIFAAQRTAPPLFTFPVAPLAVMALFFYKYFAPPELSIAVKSG
jgi:hypothetical protein